ncbi:MAG TPA: AMMECR1 domain-containing protein [Polyangiaceae bacterium]|jgi:AMMECR1 domain-containing protein
MASPKTRALTALPCVPLARPLTRGQREGIAGHVRAMLAWQRTLARWPTAPRAPDATPFVTIYARGTLRGCFGSHEGPPGERLSRAFLRALEDSRYGAVRGQERDGLAVVVSYVRSFRVIDPELVAGQVEPGNEGLGVVAEGRPPVVLLPHVARDGHTGAVEMMSVLARKAGLTSWEGTTVFALRTDDVVVRCGDRRHSTTPRHDARARAAAWLAGLIDRSGAVTFAVDARRRERIAHGRMSHGRTAVAVRALAKHGGHERVVVRAREWLASEIAAATRGRPPEGWPVEPATVAGTLALASFAGLDVRAELRAIAGHEALQAAPWHGAQVVAALAWEAPAALWRACIADLDARPWAPWTLLAARALDDADVVSRTSRAMCDSIRACPPHEGGCGPREIPEIALTALVAEALDGLPDARPALTRARRFLLASQLTRSSMPAPLDPELADGAFPASPVFVDVLRCDVTGHALLALL